MTLEEKIGMLDNESPPVAALGVPAYNWWNEASTGVANEVNKRGSNTSTTKFAFPITTGMSFNRTLWSLTGRQIGREARAMMNVGTAYSTFWAPVINLAREPRWGRNLETPGEVSMDAFSNHTVLCHFFHHATAPPSTSRILARARGGWVWGR